MTDQKSIEFKGQLVDGVKQGFIEETNSDCRIEKGNYSNGLKHGTFKIFSPEKNFPAYYCKIDYEIGI